MEPEGKGRVLRSGRLAEDAQVAEWLMAADCKSAALCATEVRILPCAPFFCRFFCRSDVLELLWI